MWDNIVSKINQTVLFGIILGLCLLYLWYSSKKKHGVQKQGKQPKEGDVVNGFSFFGLCNHRGRSSRLPEIRKPE
jgi:hypothetical protein